MELATREPGERRVKAPVAEAAIPRWALVLLAALILAGFLLRWIGIADPSLSHPEFYIPGIALSPETITPPPRHGFLETLVWHFHEEPHPIGYYMAMLGWTSVFGDSETSLRAPGALLGTLSIGLVYWLGARLYGRAAGLAAAALLAFHGFHIFWSAMARMYVPGAFFGLLATCLLIRIVTSGRRDAAAAVFYVASLVAAIQTTELNWAIFAAHAGWAAFYVNGAKRSHLTVLHFLAFVISAPALLHAVYLARGGAAADPSLGFLVHYFAFGFLFEGDEFSDPFRVVDAFVIAAGFLLSVVLVAIGLTRRTHVVVEAAEAKAPAIALIAAAVASAGFMLWLAAIARTRNLELTIVSGLPIAALTWLFAARFVRPILKVAAPPLERALGRADPFVMLIALMAVAAPLAIMAVSLGKSVAVYRAFIVFIPYLLILAGAGLAALFQRRALFAAAGAACAALLAASIVHAAPRPTSPIDYKGLAAALLREMKDGDVVLIRRVNWMDAPITYYLPHDRIIGVNFAERIEQRGANRVWALRWTEHRVTNADVSIAKALGDFTLCEKVEARRGAAKLYVRRGIEAEQECSSR